MTSGQHVVRFGVPEPPRLMKQKEEAAVLLNINKENNKMRNSGKFGNIFIALLIAASFAIAGCGGGGGTAAVEEPPMEMPDPTAQEICEGDGGRYNADGSCTSAEDVAAEMAEATALSDAKDAAMAAFTAAMAAVYGAVDPVARDNAHAHAAAAGTANEAAQAATTSEMAMTHQMAAEAASEMAVEAGMTRGLGITKLANAAANQSAIDSAALVGSPAPAPVSNYTRVTVAMIGATAATAVTVDGNVDDNTATTAPDTIHQGAVVTASARHTGTAPRFTVTATPVGDTNNTTPVSLGRGEIPTALVMSGEKPGGGWDGAELVASVSGAEGYKQNAVIFTDINPPAQSYNTTTATGAIEDFTTAVDGATAINRSVITGEIPGNGGHFAGTFNANPTDNAPPRSGRFFCPSGAACSISVDGSGVLRAIQGYQFQPAIPGSIMRGDSDYLAWGFWLHVPNAVPGVDATGRTNPATVAAFASGRDPFQVSAALTGTATYNGVANGLYAAGGMVEYFKADASLTADFGGRSANDSTPTTLGSDSFLLGAVTGSISNIKAGGMDVDGSISLGRAPLIAGDGTPTLNSAASLFTGNTAGTLGGTPLSGSWTGKFYGPNRAAAGSVAERVEFPTTAAGTFGARTTSRTGPSLRILGSFGTWKAE